MAGIIYCVLWEGPVNSQESLSPWDCGGDGPGAAPAQPAVWRGAETLQGAGSCVSGGASPPRSNRVPEGAWFAHSPLPASSVHPAAPSLRADFAEGCCSPQLRSSEKPKGDFPRFRLAQFNLRLCCARGPAISNPQTHNAWGFVP